MIEAIPSAAVAAPNGVDSLGDGDHYAGPYPVRYPSRSTSSQAPPRETAGGRR